MATSTSLVQSSWQQVLPIRDSAAEWLYAALFELDPALRSLFKGDMKTHGMKLITLIGVAVNNLEHPGTLLPVLRGLGARHATYGVKDHHYETMGVALMDTLQRGLGEAFTPEVKRAWIEVYGVLAGAMKDAAATSTADRLVA